MAKIIFLLFISILGLSANIGEVSMIRGHGNIHTQNKVKNAYIGSILEKKDIVKTSSKTKMQLSFKDDTTITLGSNTTFKIEEYLQDSKNSKANFFVPKGSFKTITGKIGKFAPKNFIFKTKTSLIGIRGTIFVGEISPNSDKGDYITCIEGEIEVTSLKTSKKIILKAGKMVYIRANGVFESVKDLRPKEFELLTHLLRYKDRKKSEVPVHLAKNFKYSEERLRSKNKWQDGYMRTPLTIEALNSMNTTETYKGKFNGTSVGTFTQGTDVGTFNAAINGNMQLDIDFGNNNPANLAISNQNYTLTSAQNNGVSLNANELNQFDNDTRSLFNVMNSAVANSSLNTTVNKPSASVTGSSLASTPTLTSNTTLSGNFLGDNSQKLIGNMQNELNGSITGVNVIRNIDVNFDLDKE